LSLGIHYESDVLTAPTTIRKNIFVLRVVSAEFHTSRSESRHQLRWRNLTLLDSYLYNLPSSAKNFWILINIEWIENFKLRVFWYYRVLGIMGLCRYIWFCINFRRLRKFTKSDYWFLVGCVSVGSFFRNEQIVWRLVPENLKTSVDKIQF
jgi:hypothetical protein